jgi:hypothetical protein
VTFNLNRSYSCVKHDDGFERLFQPFDVDWPWGKAEKIEAQPRNPSGQAASLYCQGIAPCGLAGPVTPLTARRVQPGAG